MNPVISTTNLKKKYKVNRREAGFFNSVKNFLFRKYEIKKAVKGISFDIMPGERVGFVGPNGAGKSTTVKMLTGILKPTKGVVRVLGNNPFKNRNKIVKRISVIFGQKGNLWWDIPAIDTYYLFKEMYNIPEKEFHKRLRIVRNRLGIKKYLNQPVRKLSLGERMRCELGLIFLHNPEIIFLDEPTIGVDVVGKKKIRDFFKEINKEYNTTILLTSHDMVDVEKICERVIIINEGELLYDGSINDFKKKYMTHRVIELTFKKKIGYKTLYGKKVIKSKGRICKVAIPKKESMSLFLRKVLHHYDIEDVKILESDVTELIRKIFEKGEKK